MGRGRDGVAVLCASHSIAAVYIYVDFMSVCLSCLGITEIVRHFFVCECVAVCVCVCVPAFIFSYFEFQQAFASCYFCVSFLASRLLCLFCCSTLCSKQFHIVRSVCVGVCALCIPCAH